MEKCEEVVRKFEKVRESCSTVPAVGSSRSRSSNQQPTTAAAAVAAERVVLIRGPRCANSFRDLPQVHF